MSGRDKGGFMKMTFFAACCCVAAALAGDTLPGAAVHGYLDWDNFRLWKADYKGTPFKGDWFSSIIGGLAVDADLGKGLSSRVAFEGKTYRPFPEVQNKQESRLGKFAFYIHEARLLYQYGDAGRFPFEIEAGYFHYDYNRNQRNLGEYLFRSQIYPGNLYTDFDFPEEKLLGIRIGNRPFGGFHHDLLMTGEYRFYPKSDFSLSYLCDYGFKGIFNVGGGVDFHHLIPVKPALVTPKSDENTYLEIPSQTWYDSAGTAHVIVAPLRGFINTLRENDSISYLQMGTFSRELYPQISRTATHFSYQGVKLMGMISFDPKPLLGSPAVFGAQDLKIYGEAAILGIKDYPFYYDNILERIPVMAGVNLPCFHIFDVCAVEAEYYGSRLPNDGQTALRSGVPHPGSSNFSAGAWDPAKFSGDDVKWSVYLRKEFGHGLGITAQAACDHLRMPDESDNTFETIMKNPDDFWAIVRLTSRF